MLGLLDQQGTVVDVTAGLEALSTYLSDSDEHGRGPSGPLNPDVPRLPAVTGALVTATHMPRPALQEIVDLLQARQQIVLYGPPGTGKTYLARKLGEHLVGGDDPSRAQRAASTARDTINALAALSECLRHSRDDRGDDPAMLGRDGIVAFTSRLAHQQRTGQMTFRTRLRLTRRVFRFLADVHVLGMTGPGQPAAGLPAAFALRRDDIPKDPGRETRPRSLPPAVLQAIAANLDVFEQRCGVSERRITELLIDTGRRPDVSAAGVGLPGARRLRGNSGADL